MSTRRPLLEVEKLGKRFGALVALEEASLTCAAGEIHALLGENGAGKSTLVHLLSGLQRPDAGEIRLDGRVVRWRSPQQARSAGVALVHQHFMLVPSLTIAENVALACGTLGGFTRAGLRLQVESLAAARQISLGDPERRVAELSVGEQQRVEILRALARPTRILILDEPTAVLTPGEVEALFSLLRGIARSGSAVILVTHKLHEALCLADRVTVLRKGRVQGSVSVDAIDPASLAEWMVPGGRPPARTRETERASPCGAVNRVVVRNLGAWDRRGVRVLDGLSFAVRDGEVMGIAGVEGNGQRELVAALAATFEGPIEGEVWIDGHRVRGPRDARRAGLAIIPPDRQREGLVADLTLMENLLLRIDLLAQAAPRGILDRSALREESVHLLQAFEVRPPDADVRAGTLSGGNQQRLVIARELGATRPKAIVAANPSRGLDLVATARVHRALREAAGRGAAVLVLSSDLDEIEVLADRVAVLYRGRLCGPLECPVERAQLGRLMASGETG